jgi:hypothetical protein
MKRGYKKEISLFQQDGKPTDEALVHARICGIDPKDILIK